MIPLGTILAVVLGFLISRLIGGVVGEYGKRIWFSRIEPWIARTIFRKGPPEERQESPSPLQTELDSLKDLTERLLRERDINQTEILRLRVENVQLRQSLTVKPSAKRNSRPEAA